MLLLVLWLTLLIVGSILLVFLFSIDVIEELDLPIIFGCLLFPPIIVVLSVVFAMTELYNICSKNKDNIRKSLRLNYDDNTNQEHEHA